MVISIYIKAKQVPSIVQQVVGKNPHQEEAEKSQHPVVLKKVSRLNNLIFGLQELHHIHVADDEASPSIGQ
jgi:MinD-like ATPase involved in chromosome partitioning or flagellar assembly